ncbi:helix-turn-helix transcriptional regulator [Vibrio cholerae]|uniref:helix-turn-helix transcriptional regulator n=1 Tax=Vibrio cholerae TaxID=666 RepID=UPI0011D7EE81|nr:WYL domain-containing protein [Vibrio cholerae]MDF4317057.1 WYL domain-containing protein [Vibrio parahaemolyticus]TYA01383.1 WYL domain-containing transcriptional regulator [Vibrio cholerae]HBH7892776.1 WYL domain-containing transcriptional regulator [Vibrio vulnificus]
MESFENKRAVLAKVPTKGKITAQQIQEKLEAEGKRLSLRTVQRILKSLEKYGVLSDTGKPIGWSREQGLDLGLTKMDLSTAITLNLAEKYLEQAFPPSLLRNLESHFNGARFYLRYENKAPQGLWPRKVYIHQKGMPLLPSKLAAETINVIYKAVLEEKCIRLVYRSMSSEKEQRVLFHPYGIVVRGERNYLVGKFDGYSDVRQLSFNRVISAESSYFPAIIDEDFSLEKYVRQGEMGVTRSLDKLAIKLWVTPVFARILDETPLCEGQLIEPKDDDFLVHASVDDTDELRHWLLSVCNHATVLEPFALREEIKQTLRDSLSWYED